ncbi:MAG: hypothetical protein CVV24_06050, partial [Ignavibacteriae bacterium HGW-Ignavibacteriae-3]
MRKTLLFLLTALFFVPSINWGQIAAWDFTGIGSSTIASTAATTFNANLVSASNANQITRGATAGWSTGANSWRTTGFQNNGISTANTDYFQITLTATTGYKVSLSTIDARFAGTATFYASPGVTSQFAYSLDGTSFTLIGSPVTTTSLTMTQIDLSGVSSLQNVAAGTTITLRYYASGQTTTGGWGFNSASSGTNGLAIGGTVGAAISSPSTQALSINFSGVSSNQTTINWTNGDGTNRVVFVKEGSGAITNPSDGSTYTASSDWSSKGTQLGVSGYYCVYNGSSNSVTLTNLSASTTYYVQVYEYNGSGAGTIYLTSTATNNPNSQATSAAGSPAITTSISSLADFGGIVSGSNSSESSYTVSGANLTNDIVITAPSNFQITKTSGSGYSSSITLTLSGGTVATTTIYVRFSPSSADGSHSGTITNTSTGATQKDITVSGTALAAEPATQSAITFGTVTGTSLVLNFSGGNGSNRIVVARSGSAISYTPSDGAASSGVNSNFSSATDQGSGNIIVYDGTGSTVTVTGLGSGTIYYFAVYEYNVGSGSSQNYLTASPGTGSQTTSTLTYVWNTAGTGSYSTSTNWTPTRSTTSTSDILEFSGGGTVTVTNVPSESIAQLKISGNTTVSLQASASNTLTIAGGAGADLEVLSGSALNINGSNVLTITLSSGTTGSIGGTMSFTSAAHKLNASDASAITFNNGSTLTQGTGCTGNIFTNTGTASAIVFASGSTFIQQAGSNPFALSSPSSKVIFQSGSTYKFSQNAAPSFSGRTYANFEVNYAGFSQSATGSSALSIDNLTISNGVLNLNLTGGITINGNITVASGQTLTFNPASANTITFAGATAQSITNSGTLTFGSNANVTLNNSNGLTLNSGITLNGTITLTNGNLTTGSSTLTLGSSATLIGELAGRYVIGNLATTRSVGSGSGSAFGGIGFTLGSAAENLGSVSVTRVTGSHATLNGNTGINRIWSITPANALTAARSLTLTWNSDDDNSKTLTSMQTCQSTDNFASLPNSSSLGSPADASSRSMTVSLTSLTAGSNRAFTISQSNQPLVVLFAPVASNASRGTPSGFSANWGASSGATTYMLDVSTVSDFTTFVAGYNNLDVGNVTTHSVSVSTIGITYFYRVRASNVTETSSNSNTISFELISSPTATAASSITPTSFTATWESSTGATKYLLDVSTASDFSTFIAGHNNRDVGNVISLSISSLDPVTTYFYRVRAANSYGTSTNSNSISISTALAAPIALAATNIFSTRFTANWSSSAGATSHKIDVSTASDFSTLLTNYN